MTESAHLEENEVTRKTRTIIQEDTINKFNTS